MTFNVAFVKLPSEGSTPSIRVFENWYEKSSTASSIKSPETTYIGPICGYMSGYRVTTSNPQPTTPKILQQSNLD